MDKLELKRSAVVFDPATHTYTLGDKKVLPPS